MPQFRLRQRIYTFTGSVPPGPCKCPVCNSPSKTLKYPEGEQWTTLICPRCGWYQVPTEHAPYGTMFDVQVQEIVEVHGREAK